MLLDKLLLTGRRVTSKIRLLNATPTDYQLEQLHQLLLTASETTFGRYYQFKNILASADVYGEYKRVVPIHDYDAMYSKWWYRSLERERDVCWPGAIKYFALSSGTSGAPSKHIPVTKDMMLAMRKAGTMTLLALSRFDIELSLFMRQMMMLGGSAALKDAGGYFLGDLSGINVTKLPFWVRPFYKPGKEIAAMPDYESRIESIAQNAPQWDIGFIMGTPAWVQLMIERIIQQHNLNHIHDIWPNLGVYMHGGVSFEPYRKSFNRLLGKPIVYMDTYLASEGFIASQLTPHTPAMTLFYNHGIFFEFVPFNEQNFDADGEIYPNAETLHIGQVREGVDYAFLLSSCAGAWRYLLGDTIRFTDVARCEIMVTGRTKHFISVCGEHMSVENMNVAVTHVADTLNMDIREFTASAIEHAGLFAHKWYLGVEDAYLAADRDRVRALLDEKLKEVNDDYRVERVSALKDVFVEVVPLSLFYKWHESKGKMGGQSKFPRVMKRDAFAQWESFVAANLPCNTHS
jgi:hypothetical protein